jgi:tetratricopeptide (TPR) repeat protein
MPTISRPAFILLLLVAFLAPSCANKVTETDEERKLTDSLNSTIDSPELKAVNAKLLEEPSSAELYNQRAVVYRSLKEFTASENDSKRAIRLDSTKVEYYMTLADTYFGGNKTRLAKETLEIIAKKFPENNEALLKLAELHYAVRQYQQAVDYTNKALKNDENNARAYFIKGSVYREMGDTAKAISSLQTAVEQDNGFRDAYYDLGLIFAARYDPIALDYYNNALKSDPSNAQTLYARAKLLQDLGKVAEAEKEYKQIIAKDSSCADCYFNLGAISLDIEKDIKKASGWFGMAIKKNPDFAQAYYWRGYCYMRMNEKQLAKEDFRMCVKLDPDHVEAQKELNRL